MKWTTRQRRPARSVPWRVLLLFARNTAYERETLSGILDFHRNWPGFEFINFRERSITSELLRKLRPDGIIAHQETVPGFFHKTGLPTVVVTRTSADMQLPCVTCDDLAMTRQAAGTLAGIGLKHFAYVGLALSYRSMLRYEGFVQRLRELGHEKPVPCYDQPSLDPSHVTDVAALGQWLEDLPLPTGLLTFSDAIAERVFEGIYHTRLGVPEDLAMISIDNDEFLCHFTATPLTSIDPDADRVGYLAAEMLARIMDGESPPTTPQIVPPIGVVHRQSTDVLHHEDPVVVDAMQFIRTYAHEGIDANDVIEQAEVSKATLTRRFRAATSRSLREEIDRQRLAQIIEYLVHTDLPLMQVARRTGFTYQSGLNAFVRRHLNRAPSELRQNLTE